MEFQFRGEIISINGISKFDHIYKIINDTNNFYEIDLLEYIDNMTNGFNGELCIDVGANIGNHSIFFGKFIGSHVISVEPNPLILPILKENLFNNLASYTLFDCALGRKTELGVVVMPENSATNIGMAKINVSGDKNQEGNVLIKVKTLDSIYQEWLGDGNKGTVSLIKIDVEGMELEVLEGAVNILEAFHPQLFIEALTKVELNKLENYLSKFGYSWLTHWAYTPVYHFVYKPTIKVKLKAYFYKMKYNLKLFYWSIMNKIH